MFDQEVSQSTLGKYYGIKSYARPKDILDSCIDFYPYASCNFSIYVEHQFDVYTPLLSL